MKKYVMKRNEMTCNMHTHKKKKKKATKQSATTLFPRRARALKEAFFDERERERDGFDGGDDDFGGDTGGGLVGTNEREKKAL